MVMVRPPRWTSIRASLEAATSSKSLRSVSTSPTACPLTLLTTSLACKPAKPTPLSCSSAILYPSAVGISPILSRTSSGLILMRSRHRSMWS